MWRVKNIIFLVVIVVCIACNSEPAMKDAVPGWYSCSRVFGNGDSLIGQMTYYKNGQSKLEAKYSSRPSKDYKFSVTVNATGHWEVVGDKIKESFDKISAPSDKVRHTLDSSLKAGIILEGNKILEVNAERLSIEDSGGNKIEFKRFKEKPNE